MQEEFERVLANVPKVVATAADKLKPTKGNPDAAARDAETVKSWRHYLEGLWLSGLRLAESLELWWDRDDKLCVDLAGMRPMLLIPAALVGYLA